ncbi:S1 RNA-binding domain-containing protein [Selenomonas ruminantium]|jgi:predicted RNA-binding protein (virulence factor B family)|uniref:RNA-binding protein n=1 Tax=Selenomonas ruminantium TaxID=971 RepID=A0A927ZVN4_SELRU|nr:S1-like domain-containing RNA-binding protein [Selenomonas ruminantium]MBE6093740.1 RNA-binding protein [Selenomonas ruminantium]
MEEQRKKKYGPSTVATLKVVRESELGAFLDAETGNTNDDILLHKNQQTHPVSIGDEVEVFLYLDPNRKLTASMRVPKMKEGQIARLKVINVSRDGAFVDVGAERGIFMPYAGMRGRPQIGEVVWAKLYTDKSGRLAVTMEVEDEMRRASQPAKGVKKGQMVTGAIYNYTDAGAFLFSEERYIVFIANKEMNPQSRPKVGQVVTARVTYIRDDGRLNASLKESKEKALITDAEKIMELLHNRNGKMPYSDESSPEVIRDKFGISKAAFKRALGHLLRENRIVEEDGWTYLKEN